MAIFLPSLFYLYVFIGKINFYRHPEHKENGLENMTDETAFIPFAPIDPCRLPLLAFDILFFGADISHDPILNLVPSHKIPLEFGP